MSTKYKFHDQDQLYFITFAVINWIDLFIRDEYRQILLDSWRYCQKEKGLEIYAYCIMTSHIHMIIGTRKDDMQNIVRDMKRHTAIAIRKAIREHPQESRREWILNLMENAGRINSNNIGFQLWRQDNHPIEIRTLVMLHQKLDYIHNNPVAAGFVMQPEDYLNSSAKNYHGLPNIFADIILVDPIVSVI